MGRRPKYIYSISTITGTNISSWYNEKDKFAEVIVPDNQLSLAIGKSGQNARLAAKLTNWKIDIKSESQFREILEKQQEENNESNESGEE